MPATVTYVLGMNAGLYQGDAGETSPTAMTLVNNVRDVTLTMEAGEADITTRGNSGWRATAPTLRTCTVEFEMVWKPGDAVFDAVKTAFLTAGTVALAILDQLATISGAQGPVGDFAITNFSRKEALEEAVTASVTAKLAVFASGLGGSVAMKTFTDNAGRSWQVAINVDALKRVKGLLNVDLLQAVAGELADRLSSDPVLLCDVIYCLCKPQADAASVTDVAFGEAMGGDAIEAAVTALQEELVDFFPSRRRAVLRKVLDRMNQLQARLTAAAEAKLDDPSLEQQMEAALRQLDAEFYAGELWRCIWALAGIAGVAAGPHTLRELVWMAEARRGEEWSHTSWLCALIANVNRDPKKKPSPFKPDDFSPLVRRDSSAKRAGAVTVTQENVGDLRAAFESMKGTRR